MALKFRKKPVVIEAVQLTWANWSEICEFVPRPWFERGVYLDEAGNPLPDGQSRSGQNNDDIGLILRTLESQEFLARGNELDYQGCWRRVLRLQA